MRKDIECCYGRVKGRFRMFKGEILFKTRESIDNAWFTVCILHNMLHLVDVVKHVVEDAHSKPCVVDTLSRLEENLSLEHPESPLHSSIAEIDVLAHALQPPAPGMLLYCGVLLDRWHEQRDLVCAETRDVVDGV